MPNDKFEKGLAAAEARHRQILDSARGFAIIVLDREGRVTTWNDGARRILGWSEEEMLGQSGDRIFTPEDITAGWPAREIHCALEKGYSPDERWHVRKSGERFWASGEMTPLRDEAGNAVGFVKILRDRTEQRRIASTLEQLNAGLEAQVEERTRERDRLWRNSQDLLLVIGTDGVVHSVNPAWTSVLGYRAEELIGQHFQPFVHPDDVAPTLEALGRASTGPVVHFEVRIRHKDGGYRWFSWNAAPEEGMLYANGRDITTEKRQAEELARMAERRLHLALEAGNMGAWEWDIHADQVRWLEGAAAVHGQAQADVSEVFSIEDYVQRHVHPADHDALRSTISKALAERSKHHIEYRVLWPDGSVHWIEARGEVHEDEQGGAATLTGVSVDVTRRKRTEHDLEFLAKASAELASLIDPQSTMDKLAYLAVPSFADWCAVDLLEEGNTLKRVAVAHIDPGKVQLAKDLNKRFPPDPMAPRGTWQVLRKGQPDLIHEVTDKVLEVSVHNPELRDILRNLGIRSYMAVPLRTQGRTLGVVSFFAAESGRLYDESDLALAEDFAGRAAIAIENAHLYQALQEADRRKDVFLATLAHELRNPLAAISSGVDLLELKSKGDQHVDEIALMLGRQTRQLTRLVDDLMDLSRITTGKIELKKEQTSLAGILNSAIETCRPLIEEAHHQLLVKLPGETTELEADPVRLAQVFANLLTNAVKFTNPGGQIEVTLATSTSEYIVSVKDAGVGIPPDMLHKVFNMFTQISHPVHRAQGGLGIGLALVDGLVKLHEGRVEARSAGPGKGSEFIVRLPRPVHASKNSEAGLSVANAGPAGKERGYRIVVVDDNRDAATLVAELLTLLGNEVVGIFHDGPTAVAAVAELRPDVVVLDIGLPGMTGHEVARRIREQEGDRRTLLIALTGWGTASDKELAFAAGFDRHWVKPVTLEQLRQL